MANLCGIAEPDFNERGKLLVLCYSCCIKQQCVPAGALDAREIWPPLERWNIHNYTISLALRIIHQLGFFLATSSLSHCD